MKTILPLVWNKIIAGNQHNLENWEESQFIHMAVNGGGLLCLLLQH